MSEIYMMRIFEPQHGAREKKRLRGCRERERENIETEKEIGEWE